MYSRIFTQKKVMTIHHYLVNYHMFDLEHREKAYKNKHMERINYNSCGIDAGIIYLDLLTNLERISDHCASIAKRVIKINE